MAKSKIKKVGVKMLTQGSEWVVNSSIPVYGWESEYHNVNGARIWRGQTQQKIQLRVIPTGATVRILQKPQACHIGTIIKVAVIGEPENELNIELADIVDRVIPSHTCGRYYVFCRRRQQYYDDYRYRQNDPHNWSAGSSHRHEWSDRVPLTSFRSLTDARQYTLVYTGEAEQNPQNGNCITKHNRPKIPLEGDLVIHRIHLLTNAVLDEHPVV